MERRFTKIIAWLMATALLVGLFPGYAFAGQNQIGKASKEIAADQEASSVSTTGFKKVGGKTYYYSEGKKLTGWQTIDGSRYYFSKSGIMRTGLVKIGKDRYFFDKNTGHMAGMGFYKNWIISYNGKCYKTPPKSSNKSACANKMAKLIAKSVGPKKYWSKAGKHKQLYQVRRATYYVWVLAWKCKYTTKGSDYYTPYGVFYAKKFSCAGTAAALKLVLEKMGYQCTHVNKNKWTHQWVSLKMDGKSGWADAYPTGGGANYGSRFKK